MGHVLSHHAIAAGGRAPKFALFIGEDDLKSIEFVSDIEGEVGGNVFGLQSAPLLFRPIAELFFAENVIQRPLPDPVSDLGEGFARSTANQVSYRLPFFTHPFQLPQFSDQGVIGFIAYLRRVLLVVALLVMAYQGPEFLYPVFI